MERNINLRVELVKQHGTWRDVADACNVTIGKESGEKEPSTSWKRRLLKSEHSPIRILEFVFDILDIPVWVSTHLVRHKIGIEHFVTTGRPDRTGEDRGDICPRHRVKANAQALINISRKRLCNSASPETREVWRKLLLTLPDEIQAVCVPECVYRGHCPEFKTCGYSETLAYREELRRYTV